MADHPVPRLIRVRQSTELGDHRLDDGAPSSVVEAPQRRIQPLIDLADQCLYYAKRNGRNQSVTVSQMQGGRKLHAVEG